MCRLLRCFGSGISVYCAAHRAPGRSRIPTYYGNAVRDYSLIDAQVCAAGLQLGVGAPGAGDFGGVPTQQELASGSALLVDLKTNEVLYSSNSNLVVPIALATFR